MTSGNAENSGINAVAAEFRGITTTILDVIGGSIDLSKHGELDQSALDDARTLYAGFTQALNDSLPPEPAVEINQRLATGPASNPQLKVLEYRPAAQSKQAAALPALLWMHGGGMLLGEAEQDMQLLRDICKQLQCVVISVDYRLAPEHPYPAAIDDCFAALQWMHDAASELGIDQTRLAIGGVSAGGGLAASLAIRVREQANFSIVLQALLYPMLDDRNVPQQGKPSQPAIIWTQENNHDGWRAYLGDAFGQAGIPATAAAARLENFKGLAPVWMTVGDIDLFAAENTRYASNLLRGGVPTTLHIYPGAPHGFFTADLSAPSSVHCAQSLLKTLSEAFSGSSASLPSAQDSRS